jgi:hypothetical protein
MRESGLLETGEAGNEDVAGADDDDDDDHDDDDGDQDDDFQTDNRPSQPRRRQREEDEGDIERPRAKKRPRGEETRAQSATQAAREQPAGSNRPRVTSSSRQEEDRASIPIRASRPLAQSQESRAPSSSAFRPDDIAGMTQESRKINRDARIARGQGPQRRTRWSDDDVCVLIDAIAMHDCAWALIEKKTLATFDVQRTQQQIRDKARNVKVEMLKTKRQLPKNFDSVVLGQKEKDILEALGINWDRKEDDLDEDGNITQVFLQRERAWEL